MKNWKSLLILFILCLGVFCNAQDSSQKLVLEDIVPFEISSELKIIDYKTPLEKHSILLKVLKASKLDKVLGYDGDFTVFAPSNIAFEKLANITIEELLKPKHEKLLKSILSRHIIPRKLSASSILMAMCRGKGRAVFTTIHGNKIIATMNGVDIVLTDIFGNKAVIVNADSNYSNGVVHEIDTVFLPKVIL